MRQQARFSSVFDLPLLLKVSLYQSQVGVSPKHYARLIKVERARLTLKHMNEQTTTRLAAELGFYDQAHFIREFRAVIGMTPYAYMKRHYHKQQQSNVTR
jgi:AraC-like DNA-binding protein